MPFKTWAVGEEVLAADFQDYVANQVVATFVDAAQRTAQLPDPQAGQLSTLDSRPGELVIFTGTAWAPVAPYVQTGSTVVTTNGNGQGSITYPTPFATAPLAVHCIDMGTAANDFLVFGVLEAQNIAASFGFAARHAANGALHANSLTRVGWTAVGVRA